MADDQAKHKAVIALAAKIRDWQTLLFAVEDMIADQRDFVTWWDEHVRDAGNPALIVADRQQLTADDATKLTGIQKWQVSRWRTALQNEDAYRDGLIEAAQRKSGLRDDDPMAARGQPERNGPDFWPTPDSLIHAAREHMVPFLPARPIWECACGDRRLGRGIGAEVMTDKYPQDGSESLDFEVDDPPGDDLIAFTNQPFNAADAFLRRGLELLDTGAIRGLVLLLRHDHFMAGGKVEALNRAIFEVHCNWRPIWIPDTLGNPRWAFAWVYWGAGKRHPPLYLRETEIENGGSE
jgi:hypothetical protein